MISTTSVPVTGHEDLTEPSDPRGALSEFYHAFNGRDLDLMEQNWLTTEDVSMDNPLGGIRRGWAEIKPVYQLIFSGKARVQVEFYDYTIHRFGETFLAVGRERGALSKDEIKLPLSIRTSRLFVFVDGRWRQFHHHGSIYDADLLARYQAAVK